MHKLTNTPLIKIFLFAAVTYFISCRPPQYCNAKLEAPQKFLDYFYLSNAPTLVYRLQSDTSIKDTVGIHVMKDYYDPEDESYIASCEYFYDISFTHSNTRYFTSTAGLRPVEMYTGYHLAFTDKWVIDHYADQAKVISMKRIFLYPPDSIGEKYDKQLYLKDTAAVVITPLKKFEHVMHIAADSPQYLDSVYASICGVYLAPKYGIVRIEYCKKNSTEVWELESVKK